MARSKYWMKFYYEMLDDPKVGKLSDHLFRLWVNLLLIAGELNESGYLPSDDDIAWRLRPYDLETLQSDLSQLEHAKLIDFNASHARWHITKFAERQAHSSNAERQAQWRERKRKEAKEKEKIRKDIDIDKIKNVTPVTVTPVTKRYGNVTDKGDDAIASTDNDDALDLETKRKISQCDKLIKRWLGRCGQSRPSDLSHYKEHYVEPCWLLLERCTWNSAQAFDLLDQQRNKMLADGLRPARISTLNRHIFGELDTAVMQEQGKTGEKAWYE